MLAESACSDIPARELVLSRLSYYEETDTRADMYAFPWAPNPEYDSFYASGQQIWDYFKRTTKEYHLDKSIQFDTKVFDSHWDETLKKWMIKIEQDGAVHLVQADIFINASGPLKYAVMIDYARCMTESLIATGRGPKSMVSILSKAKFYIRPIGEHYRYTDCIPVL